MFVSLFVSQTQTKDFCDAFKDNRFRVDYTFFPSFKLEPRSTTWYPTDFKPSILEYYSRSLLVIGKDYWEIGRVIANYHNYNYAFHSNESKVSDVFGPQYSLAFTVYKNNDYPFYGFLRVRQILEFSFYNNFLNIRKTIRSSNGSD